MDMVDMDIVDMDMVDMDMDMVDMDAFWTILTLYSNWDRVITIWLIFFYFFPNDPIYISPTQTDF